ncbi:outer membrane beta-barrel protein [Dyella soli]|nr:outer membrane beta-barrel protein [Dyella soli]
MRKLLLSVPLGAALAAASFASHAQTGGNGDFFVNGSVGSTHADIQGLTDQNSTGYSVNAGYRWNDTWGLEAGYVDLGKPKANGYFINGYSYNLALKVTGWTLGANGKFKFARDWYVSARAGAFFSTSKLTVSGMSGDVSANDTNLYVGMGLGYNITRNLGVSINFDRYEAKADGILTGTNNPYLLSGTLEYRFPL